MLGHIKEQLKGYQPKPLGQQRSYAVLLPLVYSDGEWQVLYQVRSEFVSQPGEVSFPGGQLEVGECFSQAAIREVVEELGVKEEQIYLWGEIDYLVFSDAMIRCFVGELQIEKWQDLVTSQEVARLFTVPLSTLVETSPTYYTLESCLRPENDFPFERLRGGREYPFSHHKRPIPFYETVSENIWGMTAQFTHRFIQILKEEPTEDELPLQQ